jgi:integrase
MAYLVKRKLKGGDKWYVRYAVNGKVQWLAAGTSKRSAERVRDAIAARILEGRFGLLTEQSDWTVARLLELYLKRMEVLKPASADWRRHRAAHIKRLLGAVPLEDVDAATVERYAHLRLDEKAAPGTVNSEVAVLRHAMGKAVLWKDETGLQEAKLGVWRALKGRVVEPRFLNTEEVTRLRTASAERGGAGHDFLELFLATGARPGELLRIKPEDIGERTLKLPALKGGAERVVVIDSELLGRLKESLPRMTKQRIRDHWEACRDKARLGKCRLYDLRHTVASTMLQRGATIRDVQRLFGHQSARMTEKYAHFSQRASALDSLTWGDKVDA